MGSFLSGKYFVLWFGSLEDPRATGRCSSWRQRSTTTRRREMKTPAGYGGAQSSMSGIGTGRSHAARQLLELSGELR
jgi:hypothetical protein